MLRWQAGLLAHLIVGGVVDIVTAMQFPFAGHLRDQVAGFGELADGRFQFTAEVRRNYKLRFHDLLRLLHAGTIASCCDCLTAQSPWTQFLCPLKWTVSW